MRDPFNAFCYQSCDMVGHKLRVAVKDNIAVKGMPLTCGSAYLKDYVSDYDATCVHHLRGHFDIVGKTNMDEFAMGSNSSRSIHGPVKHSRFSGVSPGGSSGGSAVAVAAGLADVALGTDTGGSVRLPASYNGIIGFKPSYGAISRHGVVPYAPSLDHLGIFGNSVAHIRQLFALISQDCPLDSTFNRVLPGKSFSSLQHVKMGTFDSQFEGAKLIGLPMEKDLAALYYITAMCEVASSLGKFVNRAPFLRGRSQHLLGDEVKRRLVIGNALLSQCGEAYAKAQRQRLVLKEMMHWLFQDVDMIISHTADPPPSLLASKAEVRLQGEIRQDMQLRLANLAGLPAISLPMHRLDSAEQFRGTMLMAAPGRDYMLLDVAEMLMENSFN
jgi:aspartyl-tRNA(Asn)/glutamyl-tRNA(Gln) amidotransferase subunit A